MWILYTAHSSVLPLLVPSILSNTLFLDTMNTCLRVSGTVVIPYKRKVHTQCSYIHCSPWERRFPSFYVFLHCLMWYVYFHLINQYCHHNQITDFVFNCTPFTTIIMKSNEDKTSLWLRSLQFGNLWELLNRMTPIFLSSPIHYRIIIMQFSYAAQPETPFLHGTKNVIMF